MMDDDDDHDDDDDDDHDHDHDDHDDLDYFGGMVHVPPGWEIYGCRFVHLMKP